MKKPNKERRKQISIAKKKIQSTLDWIDVDQVNEYHIDLKRDKKHEVVVGIKLEPHSLFLDDKAEQMRRIHLLRSSLNRLNFDIYHGFIFNPVNLDTHLFSLVRQIANEQDEVIKDMLQDDIDKGRMFIQTYRELEFFMMIKNKPGKKLEDQYHQLQQSIKNAGFQIKDLNRLDFDNYLAYAFENDLVNDFYFSRGIFDLSELDLHDDEVKEIDDEDDEY